MKYALLEHTHGFSGLMNYGDHVQSLAAEQYLPNVDFYVERDKLNKSSYEKAKIIMNGWFTYAPENWPPNENLEPLFISFHLNPRYAHQLLSKKESVEYLKRYSPIGCRDFKTVEILESYGIEAYYSFCLTTTLDIKYKADIRTNNIYFVDILYPYDSRVIYKHDPKKILAHTITGKIFKIWKKNSILKTLIPNDIIAQSINKHQYCSVKLSTPQKFDIAREALHNYASAKLVVTSRIHCALPCLALNTPVLFVLDGLEKNMGRHISRLNGTVDHMNILTRIPEKEVNRIFGKKMNIIHPNDMDWNNPPENPNSFMPLAEELKKRCYEFVKS